MADQPDKTSGRTQLRWYRLTLGRLVVGLLVLEALLIFSDWFGWFPFNYWEFHEGGSKQAVRMGPWKAVRPSVGAPLELYDLRIDLHEDRDVAAAQPDVVAKIEAYLKTARTESPHWPLREAVKKK